MSTRPSFITGPFAIGGPPSAPTVHSKLGRQRIDAIGTCQRGREIACRSWASDAPPRPELPSDRLFEPLFTTKQEGLGKGLCIARTVVKSCGGKVSAKNHASGAVFHVSGATAVGSAPGAAAPSGPTAPGSAGSASWHSSAPRQSPVPSRPAETRAAAGGQSTAALEPDAGRPSAEPWKPTPDCQSADLPAAVGAVRPFPGVVGPPTQPRTAGWVRRWWLPGRRPRRRSALSGMALVRFTCSGDNSDSDPHSICIRAVSRTPWRGRPRCGDARRDA